MFGVRCAQQWRFALNYSSIIRRSISSDEQCRAVVGTARVTTSSLFLSTKELSKKLVTVDSYKLMLRYGLIRQSSSGIYHLLPVGFRALEKLINLIDRHMQAIGGVKMAMPIVTPVSLMKESGRWDTVKDELFKLHDRNKSHYILGPTHEEAVTNLVKEELMSGRQLPLRLYQLDRKFRDEMRPRCGLLRAREFWMKDMYTFDQTEEGAISTYKQVCDSYEKILNHLNLPILKVRADSGSIGGSLSHEYHVPSSAGENSIMHCKKCNLYSGSELISDGGFLPDCPHVGSHLCDLHEINGIEVAHAFFLGTKYSEVFDLHYNQDGKKSIVQMGCYGIGVSRLLASVIEHGCDNQSKELIWPHEIAPYSICIASMAHVPSDPLMIRAMELYDIVNSEFPREVVLEDRLHLTLGARLRDLKAYGYPVSIIVGDKAPEGKLEIRYARDFRNTFIVQTEELVDTLHSYFSQIADTVIN